jgi:hypothetical protein
MRVFRVEASVETTMVMSKGLVTARSCYSALFPTCLVGFLPVSFCCEVEAAMSSRVSPFERCTMTFKGHFDGDALLRRGSWASPVRSLSSESELTASTRGAVCLA